MTPLITTLIPTYRRPTLLRRAIYSALCQTFRDIKVCVYDNASGDETAQVVAQIAASDSRLSYHCHSKNIGLIANMNFAFQQVRTPFFSLLCDDDVILPQCYSSLMAAFDRHPDALMSAAMTAHVSPHGEVRGIPMLAWGERDYYPPGESVEPMICHGHPESTAIVYRRQVVDSLGGFDAKVGTCCDVLFELGIATIAAVSVVKEVGGLFVGHSDQASAAGNDFEKWGQIVNAYWNTLPIASPLRPIVARALDERFRPVLDNAWWALSRGDMPGVERQLGLFQQAVEISREGRKVRRLAYLFSRWPWLAHLTRRAPRVFQKLFRARRPKESRKHPTAMLDFTIPDMSKYLQLSASGVP